MAITCCVIPILVLMTFVWLAKMILAVELPMNYGGIQHGMQESIKSQQKKLRLVAVRKR